jgi:transposase
MERPAREGDSPVSKKTLTRWAKVLSTTGLEKPCGNPGGPPSKAKYYLMTDSVPVP